jgi:uncharacterized protein with PhoU and TrkA domain
MSVREALIEIKDLSELMVDLAYSSVLFDSKDLAQEVVELDERVDNLVFILNVSTMLATRDVEEAESLSGVIEVGSAADDISNAAADVANIVIRGTGIHPLVKEALRQIQKQLSRIEVRQGSMLIGKKITELDTISEVGADTIALRRDKTWIVSPETEEIKMGDVLIVRGMQEGIEWLRIAAEAGV